VTNCIHAFVGEPAVCVHCGTTQADFEREIGGATCAPDFTEEIVGWRAWKIVGPSKSPRLASVTWTHNGAPFIWPGRRWTFARCRDRSCETPGEHCSCGIYAARTRSHLIGELGYAAYNDKDVRVVGEVGLAGKVIPGTQGWRAEKARVMKLYVPAEHWKLAIPLAKTYRCKIAVDNTWETESQVRSAGGGD
jgi:hypothetical protein